MKHWLKISLALCLYGFFREMRPSEPFVYEFLTNYRNVSEQQVIEIIYPMGTYWNFGLLIVVFLVTDMLRYKSVIIVSALSGMGIFATLAWTTSFEALFSTQFFYGLFMATEVAYYTYIYAKVDRERYQQVTSNSRSAILFGRFTGSLMAQLLIQFNVMNAAELNYISFGNQLISLGVSIFLPSVTTSMYFYTNRKRRSSLPPPPELPDQTGNHLSIQEHSHKNGNGVAKHDGDTESASSNGKEESHFSWSHALNLLWSHFKDGYTQKPVILWSLWWALATGGFLMVWSYMQPLWHFIEPDRDDIYNGAAEALVTLFGALSAFSAAFLNQSQVEKWDVWILTLCSALQGGFMIIAALTSSVFVSYAMYILFGTLYHFMITITSATIAKFVVEDSFALIFGINTFFALFFQVLLTIIVVSGSVLTLNPRQQYVIFGGYFLVLAAIFGGSGIYRVASNAFRKKPIASTHTNQNVAAAS